MTNATATEILSLADETFAYHMASSALRAAILAGNAAAAAEARDDLEVIVAHTERAKLREGAMSALRIAH